MKLFVLFCSAYAYEYDRNSAEALGQPLPSQYIACMHVQKTSSIFNIMHVLRGSKKKHSLLHETKLTIFMV